MDLDRRGEAKRDVQLVAPGTRRRVAHVEGAVALVGQLTLEVSVGRAALVLQLLCVGGTAEGASLPLA